MRNLTDPNRTRVGPRRVWRIAIAAAALSLAGSAMAVEPSADDCSGTASPVVAQYRTASPLLATDPAHTLSVTLHADGCAVTVLPRHYVRAGTHSERLSKRELALVQHQLATPELLRFDAASKRQAMRQAYVDAATKRDARVTRVHDEDIVEIDLHPAIAPDRMKAARSIQWSSLQQDLLMAPDDRQLVALAAARDLFSNLASRHLTQEAAP